jgi:hypothetical protein
MNKKQLVVGWKEVFLVISTLLVFLGIGYRIYLFWEKKIIYDKYSTFGTKVSVGNIFLARLYLLALIVFIISICVIWFIYLWEKRKHN